MATSNMNNPVNNFNNAIANNDITNVNSNVAANAGLLENAVLEAAEKIMKGMLAAIAAIDCRALPIDDRAACIETINTR